MFITKKELKNAFKLYKLKSKEERLPRLVLFAFPLLFFLGDLIKIITELSKYNDQITYSYLDTYSQGSFLYTLCWSVVMLCIYKKSNESLEILPQTNKSRFLTYCMSNYMFYIKISIFSLALYLIQYGVIFLLKGSAENVHLAYDFSINFLLWGFIVNLIDGFLGISIIILLGALDRKLGLSFRIITCITLFITILNAKLLVKPMFSFLGILTDEPSLILFCVKGTALWIVISLLTWIINSRTVYFKTPSTKFSKKTIAFTAFVTIFVIVGNIFVMSFISFDKTIDDEIYLSQKQMESSMKTKVNIPLDTAHLKPGDTIKIVTNCDFQKESLYITPVHPDDYSFTGTEATSIHFDNKKVEGLALVFTLPSELIHYTNIRSYTNPKLTAELKETTLYLNYSYNKNQKLFFLSPYSFMKQFDAFKDKNYFKRIIGTVGVTNGGDVYIVADKDIRISKDFKISN